MDESERNGDIRYKIRESEPPRAHTYEVTKIEVLDAETPSTSNATVAEQDTQLRIANLLQGAEIHKKSGEKILEESKKRDNSTYSQLLYTFMG